MSGRESCEKSTIFKRSAGQELQCHLPYYFGKIRRWSGLMRWEKDRNAFRLWAGCVLKEATTQERREWWDEMALMCFGLNGGGELHCFQDNLKWFRIRKQYPAPLRFSLILCMWCWWLRLWKVGCGLLRNVWCYVDLFFGSLEEKMRLKRERPVQTGLQLIGLLG